MMSLPLRTVRGALARLSSSPSYSLLTSSPATSESSASTASSASPADPSSTAPSPTWLARLQAILFFLLPSFLQRRLRPATAKPRRLYPTSWLDGLRGVASLIVYFCHYTEGNVGWYVHSYGVRDEERDHAPSSPLQLPFVRVIYSGRPMVHIFFVISGFVLSHKSLKLLRKHDYDNLHKTLSSSVFRRGFRLFLPTSASTFIIMLLIRLGWMGAPLPTFWEQLVDWSRAVWRITFSWNWDITQALPYDVHLWTIPIEMSHSMLLFVAITGLSRMKVYLRLPALFAIMIYCLKCGHWAAFEFLGGMGIAEIGMIQEKRRERDLAAEQEKEAALEDLEAMNGGSSGSGGALAAEAAGGSSSSSTSTARRAFQAFLLANLVFALFVAGWPNNDAPVTWGISALWRNTMEPFHGFGGDLVSFPWYALGSIQVVVALQQIKPLQNLFVTPLAQYLADLSYALYLCHGPVLDLLAHRLMPGVWAIVGGPDNAGMWGRMFVWFAGIVVLGVPTIWSSDLFWRTVDVKSVEFARWLESVCVRDD